MKNLHYILIVLFSLIMSGCSTDDTTEPDNSKPEEPQLQTGIFVDSKVAGLNFKTTTQSGITNDNGEFFYYEGETVTFSVGDIELGSAEGDSQLTPISIASTPDATIESTEVKNIAAFLQSLDSDANPSNGITIETAVVEALNVNEIDFTGNIVSLLGEMVAEINLALGSSLEVVYPEEAATHMAATLGEEYDSTDFAFNSFLPVFSHYYSTPAVTSFYWVHETDDEGRLLKSSRYEKYPNRISMEISYTAYNELMLPTEFEMIPYSYEAPADTQFYTVNYTEDHQLQKITRIDPDTGGETNNIVFEEINEDQRASIIISSYSNQNMIQRQERSFDESGNVVEMLIVTEGESSSTSETEITYTAFGDIDLRTSISGDITTWTQYYYREDHTMEKFTITYSHSDNFKTYEYDENEVISKAIQKIDLGTVIWYYEDGVVVREEWLDNDGNPM